MHGLILAALILGFYPAALGAEESEKPAAPTPKIEQGSEAPEIKGANTEDMEEEGDISVDEEGNVTEEEELED
jgi:hypothetical protein